MPDTQRVTLVSAAPSRPGHLTVAVLADGRQLSFEMESYVAAALAGDVVRALGSSLLYDAGLEAAAATADEVARSRTPSMPGSFIELAARLRSMKVGRTR